MTRARPRPGAPRLHLDRPLAGETHEDRFLVCGWAGAPGGPCVVELRRDGELVASAVAELPRPDVRLHAPDAGAHAGGFRLEVDLADRLPMWIDLELTARGPDGTGTVRTVPCVRRVDRRRLHARPDELTPLVWLWSDGIHRGLADEWIRLHGCVITRGEPGALEAIVAGERIPLVLDPADPGDLGLAPADMVTVRSFRQTLDLCGRGGQRVELALALDGRPLGRGSVRVDPSLAAARAQAAASPCLPARDRPARGLVVVAPGDPEPAVAGALAALAAQHGVRWTSPPEAVAADALPALLRRHAAGPAVPLVCCDPGDELVPTAAAELLDALLAGAAVAFADEIDAAGRLLRRPAWSPELALATDSTGGLVALRAGPAAALAQDDARSVAALLAGAVDEELEVRRLPRALRRRSLTRPGQIPDARRQRVARRRGLTLTAEPVAGPPGARRLRWAPGEPSRVAVVIPSTGRPGLLVPCLRSLAAATGAALEIVVVDSGCSAATLAATAGLPPARVVRYDRPQFNFSHACNLGWRATQAPCVLFLNDDIVAPPGDWLAAMAGWARVPAVGAVGARLLLPTGLLQHDGVLVELTGDRLAISANEVERGLRASSTGYGDLAFLARDRTAVTGAAMLVPRPVLEQLDGWDEALPIDYGDIDLCLRIRDRLGRRVIVEPAAELVHHVSSTRSRYGDVGDHRVFTKRWGAALARRGDQGRHPAFVVGSDHVVR